MNVILREASNDRKSLIGKKVIYHGRSDDIIKQGDEYTIKKVSLGNYDCFLHLVELPERICRPFTTRREGYGNVYDSKNFILKEETN